MMSHRLFEHRYFKIALALKVMALILWVPDIQQQWFVPFVRHFVHHPTLDPWQSFLSSGGQAVAFPYGIVMLLVHLPFVAMGSILDTLLGTQGACAQVGFAGSLLAVDMTLLWTLARFSVHHKSERLLIAYWCSPIVFFITYWHGQTDLVPVCLMVLGLCALKEKHLLASGAFLGLSIAAKLSAALILPFMAIVLIRNPRYHPQLMHFSKGLASTLCVFWLPTLLLPGAWHMIYESPQMGHLWDFQIPVGPEQTLYVLPILFSALLYKAWEIRRMDTHLLSAFLGMAFFFLILFCQAPVGWTLWIVPFLALYQLKADAIKNLLISIFNGLFVLSYAGQVSGANWIFGPITRPEFSFAILYSCLIATGVLLAINMMRQAMKHNRFVALTRQPVSIGIAGDSCTGKDTLSLALAGLFGENRVAALSGDDYHRYERQHGLWEVMTHLNPKANYLHDFAQDATNLLKGQTVFCRKYDHHTGRFHPNKALKPSDVLLISGLHTFTSAPIRSALKVKVFLSMQDTLRQHLKLKRDVALRGHAPEQVLASMAARTEDYKRYVAPQADFSDVHFYLSCAALDSVPLPLALTATFSGAFDGEHFSRVLLSHTGLVCQLRQDNTEQVLKVPPGAISSDTIERLARVLVPQVEEVLALKPKWQPDLIGIMQLLTVMLLDATAKIGEANGT